MKRLAALLLAALTVPVFGTAAAQGPARNPLPPDTLVKSPGDVDMRSGRMTFDAEELSIGDPGRGGLSFKRVTVNTRPTPFGNDSYQTGTLGQFSDSWDIKLVQMPRPGFNGYDLSIGSNGVAANFFTFDRTNFTSLSPDRPEMTSTISGSNATYTMKTKDGRVFTFAPIGTGGATANATQVRQADGIVYTLTYGTNRRRVQSNAGYALLIESGASGVTKACVLNLTVQTLPAGDTCPAGVPTASYAYTGKFVSSITKPDGSTWQITNNYVNDATPFDMAFYFPGSQTPYLTNHFVNVANHRVVGSQDYGDGRHYDYEWDYVEYGETDTTPSKQDVVGYAYTMNNTDQTITSFASYPSIPPYAPVFSPGPAIVTDPLGRTTTFTYCMSCVPTRLDSRTLPLGLKEDYLYDWYRNITKIIRNPGRSSAFPSPPPATNTDYTYSCATMVYCAKPLTMTDAKGNQTVNVYDEVHGGLLKTTGPAVGGVTPQTRYTYAQRSAWIKSGSTYVQATPAIWVPTAESFCRTGAPAASGIGCAIAGDEVVTTYDYGPDSGPNNLLLRGKVVTADGTSLRTCYGYDAQGNRISETSPRGGLTSCP